MERYQSSLILCLVNFSASTPSHQNPDYTIHQARRVKSRGSHAPARGPPSYDWEGAEARSARYVRMRFQHDATREGGVEHRQSATTTWIFLARDTLIHSIAPDLPSATISISIVSPPVLRFSSEHPSIRRPLASPVSSSQVHDTARDRAAKDKPLAGSASLIRAAHNPDYHPPAYLYLCLNSEPSHATHASSQAPEFSAGKSPTKARCTCKRPCKPFSIGCARGLHGPPVPPSPVRLCLSLSRHPRHDRGQGCRGRRTGTGNRVQG